MTRPVSLRWICRGVILCAVAPALSGCAEGVLSNPSRLIPNTSSFANIRAPAAPGPKPITPDDLVNADGQCPGGAPAAPEAGAGGLPPAAAGVALEMSECEVVSRTGPPSEVQVGSDERGRTATIVYRQGIRPGIYRFRGGRLVSIEATPDAVPEKPAKPAKKKRAAG